MPAGTAGFDPVNTAGLTGSSGGGRSRDSSPSLHFYPLRLPLEKRRWETGGEGSQTAQAGTSFRLEVGDAVHDHVVQKQGLVVHFDGAREQATEVVHVPGAGRGAASAGDLS